MGVEENKLTPQEFEQQLIKQAEERANRPPEEVMAEIYTNSRPLWESAVDKMSSNQMRRMLKNIVRYPIDHTKVAKDEQTALLLADKLLFTKFTMLCSFSLEEEAARLNTEQEKEEEKNG